MKPFLKLIYITCIIRKSPIYIGGSVYPIKILISNLSIRCRNILLNKIFDLFVRLIIN